MLANLSGLEVLTSNSTHLLPVSVSQAGVKQGGYQRQVLLELIHSGLHLHDGKKKKKSYHFPIKDRPVIYILALYCQVQVALYLITTVI